MTAVGQVVTLPRGRPRRGTHLPLPRLHLVTQPLHVEAEAARQLWCAVLSVAFHDALGRVVGPDHAGNAIERSRIVQEAFRWFRDGTGDFRRICWLAGFDPAIVRTSALAQICASRLERLR